MENQRFSIPRLLSVFLLIAMLVTACGVPSSVAPTEQPAATDAPTGEAEATEAPTEQPTLATEAPTEQPTLATEVTVPWQGQVCPNVDTLPDGEPAYLPEWKEIVKEGDFLVQDGQYINPQGQIFEIRVKGVDPGAIEEYRSKLKVCLELVGFSEPTFETNVTDETDKNDIPEAEYFARDPRNLIITMAPTEETAASLDKVFLMVYIIDPPINSGQYQNYPDLSRSGSRWTKVTMGASGGIDASHYKSSVRSGPRIVNASGSTSWNYYSTGNVTYDLCIYGRNTGNYTYSVTGTLWYYGYSSAPPPSTVRCP